MFHVWCTTEQARVLRWTTHVEEVRHPWPGAIDLVVRCLCGAAVLVQTGRDRGGDHEVHGVTALAVG